MGHPILCQHHGVCGGCSFQDRAYKEQLKEKEKIIYEVVRHFFPGTIHKILPSPDVFYYRNKMEFAFGAGQDQTPQIGLREKKKFANIVDLQECHLMAPSVAKILRTVRAWASREKVSPYHLKSHKGFLRYLVLREGKNTGEWMVNLVTARGELPKESFLSSLNQCGISFQTVIWTIHDGVSDVACGDESYILHGSGTIKETLDDIPFILSPTTFFQTNTKGAEILYSVIRDYVGSSVETLFDFYCGAGAIGLFCAKKVKRLIGVEVHGPSIKNAQENKKLQGVNHAEFIKKDASDFVKTEEMKQEWIKPGGVAIMDPPRSGLQKSVRHLLMEYPIAKWIYVSCNPKALAQDLPILSSKYIIEQVQPVDMFPHTPHVETVLLLSKKTP